MHWRGTYLKILGMANLFFAAMPSNAQVPTTPQQIKTDIIARKAIRLLNQHKADSVYILAGDAFHQQATLAQWQQVSNDQISGLLPFNKMVFKGSQDLVSKYKIEGKIDLTRGERALEGNGRSIMKG